MSENPPIEISGSRQLVSWLLEQHLSLAFTTCQSGKLFFIGAQADGRLSIVERSFPRCMGLHATGNSLYLASLYQIWRFENSLEAGQEYQGYDALYVPQLAWTTGDLDVHDLALDSSGRPVFVNTLFSGLATVSEGYSFSPLWHPPFISRLAAEDRCHLNGMAMKDGKPAYVTSVGKSDVADGWREQRAKGGLVMDVESNEVVLAGLSMPHSPRWYKDRLWLLDSGNGYFGYVDIEAGRFVPVSFCPGYARGLSFFGDFAIIGLSLPRHEQTFGGLKLDEELDARNVKPRCGLQIVDLRSGDAVHWLRIEGLIEELFDVTALPGIRRPLALGLMSDEIRRTISLAPSP